MKKTGNIFKSIAVIAMIAVIAFSFAACGGEEDVNAPANLEIHDSYAGVENIGDGSAMLLMQGVITNNSELKTIDYADLPYLTIDGEQVETVYEPIDSEDTDKVAPGKSVVYAVSAEFDPSVDHEWGFGYSEDTVVDGLDEYSKIKEALRNLEGKAPITMEEIKEMEKEQIEKFKEFEAGNN